MYSGGNIKDGDILYLGNIFNTSPIFDTFTKWINASIWRAENFISRKNGLQIYFGENARQDEEYLYLKKTDLPGLTPSNNNTAESLLVALILKASNNTNEEDDSIIIKVFDTYIVANKIRNTILIQATYKTEIIDYEIQDYDNFLNPNNYE